MPDALVAARTLAARVCGVPIDDVHIAEPPNSETAPGYVVPLIARDGNVKGAMRVRGYLETSLSGAQVDALASIGAQMAELIGTTQLDARESLLPEFALRLTTALQPPTDALSRAVGELSGSAVVDGPLRRYVRQITSATERLTRMQRDLAEYATAGTRVVIESVDVKDVAQAALTTLRSHVGSDPTDIEFDTVPVQADPALMSVLLRHLLENALLYHSGPPVRIAVSTHHEPRMWTLRVADNGPGIPDEERRRVLEPTVRLDRDVHLEGTGLGLATCVRIASAHLGGVRVEQTPGGGTTVVVMSRVSS